MYLILLTIYLMTLSLYRTKNAYRERYIKIVFKLCVDNQNIAKILSVNKQHHNKPILAQG